MAKEKASVPFDFAGLMATMGDRTQQGLYGMFPQTAARYSGAPAVGYRSLNVPPSSALSNAALAKGAQGVAMMGTRRLPLLAGGLQALSGDPIGGVGTAGGGFAGAALGAKIGSVGGVPGVVAGGLIGGMLGSSVGQGITRGIAGIDINDPYSGPDISLPIFGGIPITPAAKTKKSRQRMREERMKDVEAMAPYMRQQFAMDMMSQQNAQSAQLMGNIISNSRR